MSKAKVGKSGDAKRKQNQEKLRPPIVAVLGHVDHGKTTLLDKIRSSKIAQREAGGITQSIGASKVRTKNEKDITFIDTPGHAAFSKMRSRGARVADIAVLVVAANDGVKPQTKEALQFIREAEVPFIVAATKIDLATADASSTKTQLKKLGVKFEDEGGDVPFIKLSGKTGKGIEDLLEMISLVAEINEVKGSPAAELEAVVIETDKDKRGLLVSTVVRDGVLRARDEIFSDKISARARGLFDHNNKPVKRASPGDPVLILGFGELPRVGSKVIQKKDQTSVAKKEVARREVPEVKESQLPVVLKASSAGSLEAVLSNMPIDVVVIYSGIGDVTESDVFLAKSSPGASIVTFEAKASKGVTKLADTEGLKIYSFNIIYELFDKLEELVVEGKEKILGKAEILKTFPFNNNKVAGCKVLEGVITNKDKIVVVRSDKKLGQVKINSMKREKKNIEEAKAGEEFGVVFTPQLDFEIGDAIISIR